MADITHRDVKKLKEAQDFAQRVVEEYESLRLRPGVSEVVKEASREASNAAGVLDASLESLHRKIEREEDVRL